MRFLFRVFFCLIISAKSRVDSSAIKKNFADPTNSRKNCTRAYFRKLKCLRYKGWRNMVTYNQQRKKPMIKMTHLNRNPLAKLRRKSIRVKFFPF